MTDGTTYEDQIDPELLARIDEWRRAQAEVDTEPDDEADSEFREVMEDSPVADNHGRASTWVDGRISGEGDDLWQRADKVRKIELGEEGAVVRGHLREGGWHIAWREPTGQPPGRPPAHPHGVAPELADALVDLVGFSREEVTRLTRRGGPPRTAEENERRDELGRRLADVMRRGRGAGVEAVVLDAYGFSRHTLYRLARTKETETH